jgi:hypothetical protein
VVVRQASVRSMIACVVLGSFAAGVATAKVSSNAAARACAGGRELGSRLGGRDVSYLHRFVPCVVREFRRQLGDTFRASTSLSRDVDRALPSLASASYKHAAASVSSAGQKVFSSSCGVRGRFGFFAGDSTPPPVMTPAALSAGIETILFKGRNPVARQASAVFGFAYRRGVLFHDGSSRGAVALGVYALYCPMAPPALPSGQVTFTDIGVWDNYHPGAAAWKYRTRLVRAKKSFGTGSGDCTHRSRASSNNCSETFRLANGSITVQIKFGLLTRPKGGTGTIVRGTGAFRHARGEAVARAIGNSTNRITLRFR